MQYEDMRRGTGTPRRAYPIFFGTPAPMKRERL